MNSRIKELPLNFLPAKQSIQKLENTYWYNKLNDKQEHSETKENLGLLYALENELVAFTETKQYTTGEKLLLLMGTENDWQILLGQYGKKIIYCIESRWIEIVEMNEKDYVEWDEKNNKEFLANRNK